MISLIGIQIAIIACLMQRRWLKSGNAYTPNQILGFIVDGEHYKIQPLAFARTMFSGGIFWVGAYAIYWDYTNVWSLL